MTMEHRWGVRQRTCVSVRFDARGGVIGSGRLINISATGAFLETADPPAPLAMLQIRAAAASAAEDVALPLAATVVRRIARGVGLEWCPEAGGNALLRRRLAGWLAESRSLGAGMPPTAETAHG